MDFSRINQATAQSFNEQKNLIKRIGKGHAVHCQQCGQLLQLRVPGKDASADSQRYGIFCPKKCTDIELEFEA